MTEKEVNAFLWQYKRQGRLDVKHLPRETLDGYNRRVACYRVKA